MAVANKKKKKKDFEMESFPWIIRWALGVTQVLIHDRGGTGGRTVREGGVMKEAEVEGCRCWL